MSIPAVAFVLATVVAGPMAAQPQTPVTAPEDSFSLEAAILDTAIPFAVGAHEARQELRGAFGWPTFQEGLVEGVYFRFDPDGYARFSPTPRLDVDVFEVICRPRTHVCMARKGAMSLTLASTGQIQIALENIAEGDQFSVAEGISELQLPGSILQPLEPRLELLLSSGGDLVVRRAQKEVDRISLKGFAAVTSYLRWVTAQQDYSVLPRTWPIPNAAPVPTSATLTQTPSWQSPMPQPVNPAGVGTAASPEVAEVRGELRVLRELLLQNKPAEPGTAPQTPEEQLQELQQAMAMLSEEITRLQTPAAPAIAAPLPVTQPLTPEPTAPTEQTSEAHRMATQLEYLMTEIGLAPDVALMLVQQNTAQSAAMPPIEAALPEQDVVNDILDELRAQIPETAVAAPPSAPVVSEMEYQLLSDYFRSVFPQN
jgi:hypothetical protein